ncbi:MAG: hypothetical protein KatS3mg014_1618 [Actinomycetota bacterium]|nr:MAG: hypothetical protein KatS3mg014_1618 [Actinomycetota bacterium]
MSSPAAPSGVALATAGWGRATRQGAIAFLIVAAVAEGAALVAVLLGGVGRSPLDVARIGGAELALVHRVPLRLSAEGTDLWLATVVGAPAGARSLDVQLTAALLGATALAAWRLWRAGHATAAALGGGPAARALHGAKVAPAYAILVALATLPARLALRPAALDLRVELSVAPLAAFLLPLALAGAAGAAGGWWSSDAGGAARAAVLGGWTMLLASLGLTLGGLVVAGAVRPEGPEGLVTPTTGRYVRAVLAHPGAGAAILAHHVTALPNEAVWALAPAMGGCTGAFPSPGKPTAFLCPGRFPLEVGLPVWLRPPGAEAGETRFGPAPWPYLVFLAVPAAGSLLGGRRAGAAAEGRRRLAAGVGAGVVFAALVLVVGWASSLSLSSAATTPDGIRTSAVRLGPDLVSGGILALGWGVAGGALGAALVGLGNPAERARLRARRSGSR